MGLMDKFVQNTDVESCAAPDRPDRAEPGDGLLRRQHSHRAVELRPALRDERQLLQRHLRALDAGRDERDLRQHVRRDLRPDQRRVRRDAVHRGPGQRGRDPRVPAAAGHRARLQRRRPQLRHLLVDPGSATPRLSTIQMGGENVGDLLDKAGVSWGWFQGGFASPTTSPGSRAPTISRRSAPAPTTTSAAPPRSTTALTTSRSSTTHRPPTRSTCRRRRSRRSATRTRPTTSTT